MNLPAIAHFKSRSDLNGVQYHDHDRPAQRLSWILLCSWVSHDRLSCDSLASLAIEKPEPGLGVVSATERQMSDTEEEFVNITSVIEGCASELSYSKPYLCNEQSFSLHDSMAALELMDRKMDCCEIPASVVGDHNSEDVMIPPRPLPKGLDDPVFGLPWDELSVEDAGDICFHVLTRLEALVSGASTAESTYTFLYAHNAVVNDMKSRLDPNRNATLTEQFGALLTSSPDRVVGTTAQHAVYAVTLAMVECSDLVRNIILHADIFEEEDFSISTFGLEPNPDNDDEVTSKAISTTMEKLKKEGDSVAVQIIRYTLQFQLLFLRTCSSMAKLSSTQISKVVVEARSRVKTGIDHLKILRSLIDEEKAPNPILRRCFDQFVYRPLVGSSPIRKVGFKPTSESIAILINVFEQISGNVCNLLANGTTLGKIRRLLDRMSSANVNILSRSLIVLNLYFDDKLLGQHNLGQLVGQELAQLSEIPNELLESRLGVAFLNRLAKPVYDTLKLSILNRNRQRGYLEEVMLPEWSSLQQEGHGVDVSHRAEFNLSDNSPAYFTHYTLLTTVRLMDLYVALAVELRLFEGFHDLAVAFWYRDFLLSSMLNTLSVMRKAKAAVQQHQAREQDSGGSKGKGKKKGGRNGHVSKKTVPSVNDILDDVDFMLVGLKRSLCRGSVRFIASLTQAKVVATPTFEFTSHSERFSKRFSAFLNIPQPPLLTYGDFQQGSDFSNVAQSDLLAATGECFKSAKSMVDSLSAQLQLVDKSFSPVDEDDVRTFAKICVGNSVFLMKLSQQVRGGNKAIGKATTDFDVNKQFCTIKIS